MTYKHHVIPFHEWKRRINPNATRKNRQFNTPDNVVWLTLEQHIQVHQLLFELNGSEYDRIAAQLLSGLIDREEASSRAAAIANKGNKYSVGCIRTTEQRTHHSEIMKGNQIWLGRKHTEETKQKISSIRKGSTHTDEWKLQASMRMRGNQLNKGRVWSEEYKKNMSKVLKEKHGTV